MSDEKDKPDYGLLMQTLRNLRDNEQAEAFEEKRDYALSGLHGDQSEIAHMYRSKIAYEEGMLRVALEQDDVAARCFDDSGEHALLAEDSLRWNVGLFRSTITKYFADLIDEAAAHSSLERIYDQRPARPTVPSQDQGFFENSDLNFRKRLMEGSFDAGTSDARMRAEEYMEHPTIVQGVSDGVPMYLLVKCQTEARILLLDKKYDEAVDILSSYLEVDVPDAATPKWIGDDIEPLKDHANNEAMEICRDYRDLGRALLKSSRSNRATLAMKTFERGMRVPAKKGNKRFLRQLTEDLAQLTQSD